MKQNPYQKIIDEMSVEECIQGIEKLDICCNRAEIVREKAKQLLERHIPKKVRPNKRVQGLGKCPICKTELCIDGEHLIFCPRCGQAIDCEVSE